MELLINQAAIQIYSKESTENSLFRYFPDKSTISGKEILNFCGFKQINLLVIKQLFENWQKTIENARSPYFDYQNPEVENIAKQFANVLSQHILVQKEDLKPLLKQAVADTLLLILHPYSYFVKELQQLKGQVITHTKLQETFKYVNIHQYLAQDLIKKVPLNVKIELFEAITLFKDLYEEKSEQLASVELYISQLNDFYPCNLQVFILEKEPKETILEAIAEKNIRENLRTDNEDVLVKKTNEMPQNIIQNSFFGEEKQPGNYANNQENLANQESVLVENNRIEKIDSIRNAIDLNTRLRLISALFEGNHSACSQFLTELEQCMTLGATQKLVQVYTRDYHWAEENSELSHLQEIINKKF